jgi:WD40 repeat protein
MCTGLRDLKQEIAASNLGHLTSLAVDRISGNHLLAGSQDGKAKLFDIRLPETENVVAVYDTSSTRIIHAKFLPNREHEFLTASKSGEIMLWDIRQSTYTLKIETSMSDDILVDNHINAPLIAWYLCLISADPRRRISELLI